MNSFAAANSKSHRLQRYRLPQTRGGSEFPQGHYTNNKVTDMGIMTILGIA